MHLCCKICPIGRIRPMTQKKNREFWRIVKFVLFSASAGIIEMGVFALLN